MYYPHYQYVYSIPVTSAYVRILHASPDAPAVDIYANNVLIAQNLAYRGFTQYLSLAPATYRILVYPTGTRTTPVIDTQVNIAPNGMYTIAAAGLLQNIEAVVVPDTAAILPPNRTQLKFVHLSPNAPAVDITLPNGTVLFPNISFGQISNNITVVPANYTLQARIAGTNQIVLTVPNTLIRGNRYYTVYAVGLVDANPPLQALIALDKASY
ncbi:DUF4397 domain-containing protein [Geosporobacter ferrireducens]|uniref:DUF4397 domain-containing protein n=2 Tax=Geosporobacter ferrireducens TaxID=1424294 RepID=A0A1D8GMP6_9FIRM|nr:DUF4397 domain-containing protein [Geosporobacter ferrireducens]AOT72157.1 hypothetical protein Gferi_23010 [Geosporobacter ferrireducens]MTI56045.1 DUF4397 domain-containing protein [Geosporobacter ferrireducens]